MVVDTAVGTAVGTVAVDIAVLMLDRTMGIRYLYSEVPTVVVGRSTVAAVVVAVRNTVVAPVVGTVVASAAVLTASDKFVQLLDQLLAPFVVVGQVADTVALPAVDTILPEVVALPATPFAFDDSLLEYPSKISSVLHQELVF